MILILSSLSLLSTIVVLILHHRDHQAAPPRWLNRIYSTVACMTSKLRGKVKDRRSSRLGEKRVARQEQVVELLMSLGGMQTSGVNASGKTSKNPEEEEEAHGIKKVAGKSPGVARKSRFVESKSRRSRSRRSDGRNADDADPERMSALDIREVLMRIDHLEGESELTVRHLTWSKMTDAFDKFLLFCFVSATVLGAVLLLYVFPGVDDIVRPKSQLTSCRFADSLETNN